MGRKSPESRLLHSTFWHCVGRTSLSGAAILLLIKKESEEPRQHPASLCSEFPPSPWDHDFTHTLFPQGWR